MLFQMRHITVLINFLLLIGFQGYTQEIVIPKDTIYLKFKPNDGSLPHYRGIKFRNKNGLNFNLYEGNGLIYPNSEESDTLPMKDLQYYHFTELKHLDSLGRQWYRKNLNLLQKKWGEIFPPHDKNGKFVTYLIEDCGDHFIKYRVYWRNEHTID